MSSGYAWSLETFHLQRFLLYTCIINSLCLLQGRTGKPQATGWEDVLSFVGSGSGRAELEMLWSNLQMFVQ